MESASTALISGPLLKPRTVAKELDVHIGMVYRLLAAGSIAHVRVGADARSSLREVRLNKALRRA